MEIQQFRFGSRSLNIEWDFFEIIYPHYKWEYFVHLSVSRQVQNIMCIMQVNLDH